MSLVIMILLKTTSFINGTQRVSKFKLQKTMKTLKKLYALFSNFITVIHLWDFKKGVCFLTSYFGIGIRFPFSLSN